MLAVTLPFLNDIVGLLAASVVIAYACFRLRIVPIAGFLIAGIVIGPHALGLVSDQQLVDQLAEIGVILLLFSIGIEFSLAKLASVRRAVFVGGGLQVVFTVAAVAGLLALFGVSWRVGVFTGCLVALSSTAIVLGLLGDRGETDSPSGRLTLAILIFQDLAIVLMVLLIPMLAGQGGTFADLGLALAKAGLLVAGVLVLARRIVPWILERVAGTRRPELFILTVVAICFGTAALSSAFGVSLALGAFLAGLVVSESRFSTQAVSDVLPLRTLFNAVFFVSVGMLLDVRFLMGHPLLVLGAAATALVLKAVLTGLSVRLMGYPIRLGIGVGLALAQIGEFSFVLERAGRAAGLAPAGLVGTGDQTFIAATVLLMLFTPLLMEWGPRLGMRYAEAAGEDASDEVSPAEALQDHAVVVGYGPAGRRLTTVLRDTGLPFIVVDMNPEAIDDLHAAGMPALYGDGARRDVLHEAGIERAKIVVVLASDRLAGLRITHLARHLNPTALVIVRTRMFSEIQPLHDEGADIVVPEELETTVRIFSHVLGAYLIPPEEIDRHLRTLRADDYGILRSSIQEAHLMVLQGLDEEGLHTRAIAVRRGAPAAGQSLQELSLRRTHRLNVLAVRRGGRTLGSPSGDFLLEAGDRLVAVAMADDFAAAAPLFRADG